jgi:hypothetical protein
LWRCGRDCTSTLVTQSTIAASNYCGLHYFCAVLVRRRPAASAAELRGFSILRSTFCALHPARLTVALSSSVA